MIVSIFPKIAAILSPAERSKAGILFVFMLVGMALEVLGVGLIVPALGILLQPQDLSRWLGNYEAWIPEKNISETHIMIGGMVLLVIVFAVKTAFLSFLAFKQFSFIYRVQAEISKRLFEKYLRQSYAFHLEKNSAQLIRNITTQVVDVTKVLQASLLISTELLVLAGLATLLLVVEPIGALSVVGLLLAAGWLSHSMTRRRLTRWGLQRQEAEGMRLKHLHQGLGGIKEVIVFGCDTELVDEYARHTWMSAKATSNSSALQVLPRLGLEMLAVASLSTLVCVMIWQGKPVNSLVPVLGLFAGAAFRFMPSVNRIITALQTVRFSVPALDSVREELAMPERKDFLEGRHHEISLRSEIKFVDVTHRYPNAARNALDSLSLIIRKGTSVGVIGESGSGKSTLVDLLLGLLRPTRGHIEVDGTDVAIDLVRWRRLIGYVPQNIYLTDDTIRRNIAFGLPESLIDDEIVCEALESAQLLEFVRDLPSGLNTVVGERGVRLSGGQRQRIGIARALYHKPDILVFDEATSALDNETEKAFVEALEPFYGTKTMIIVAHRLSTVERCDVIVRLKNGKFDP